MNDDHETLGGFIGGMVVLALAAFATCGIALFIVYLFKREKNSKLKIDPFVKGLVGGWFFIMFTIIFYVYVVVVSSSGFVLSAIIVAAIYYFTRKLCYTKHIGGETSTVPTVVRGS